MIVLDKQLSNLRAVNDRIEGVKYPRADDRQKFIQRLRYLGSVGGKFYYADQNDVAASLPKLAPLNQSPAVELSRPTAIIRGGTLFSRRIDMGDGALSTISGGKVVVAGNLVLGSDGKL